MPTVGAEERKLIVEAPEVVSAPDTLRGARLGFPNDARSIVSPDDEPSVSADVVNCVSSPPATVTPSVVEALSVTLPAGDAAVVTTSLPPDTATGPVKLFAPVSESEPAPTLVKPPEPVRAWGRVTVKPAVSTIAPPAATVAEPRPDRNDVWSARAASVPPLNTNAEPAPPAPPVTWFTRSVPPLRLTVPLVVAPALPSTSVGARTSPAPDSVSDPRAPSAAPTARSPTCTSTRPPDTVTVPRPVAPVPISRSPAPVFRTRPPDTFSVPLPPLLPTATAVVAASVPEEMS